jgi:hypothetical protein
MDHLLQIQSQTAQEDGTAVFTAAWDGGQTVTGTLAYNDAGNVYLTATGDSVSLAATISGTDGAYQIRPGRSA